ncbi:hypothetical protein Ga0123462_0180 [Mariprofundus ferrinatatus]|uniref:Uncharacterized protein n=1 Tax=Mariprofundus ferrinatatus TaxID=1921087 RepID=A0A2K8L182_9PROT|nr:hypothetical protein [Mariprofundus ferrinatatus]ATX81058.1 hypothetical protein Ga0123462_0180 [Mariprofundus ferrinatatus]
MGLIWCLKHGKGRGFKNELTACVACDCRHRKSCESYASMPLDQIVEANAEAKRNGHQVFEDFPLFESVHK